MSDDRREYRAWITDRAKGSKWMYMGRHENVDEAWTAAHKRWGKRLISVRSVPTEKDPTVERRAA